VMMKPLPYGQKHENLYNFYFLLVGKCLVLSMNSVQWEKASNDATINCSIENALHS
jgi:hypothetical protein